MKKIKIPLLTILLTLIFYPLHAAPPAGNFTLTFEDNFEGSSLDGSKWKMGGHYGGIQGQGGNNPENISVSGGTLKLIATDVPTVYGTQSFNYSAGEISTFTKFKQTYGYFEARMRWDSVTGLWPAFWTMPDRGDYGNPYLYDHGFIKFDLGNAGIGSVSSATLRLKIANLNPLTMPTGKDRNLILFRMGDSWSETTTNWNNQPNWDPVYIKRITGAVGQVGDVLEFDVTDYVNAENNGDKVVSFALADTFMTTSRIDFHSSEAANSVDRPQLLVNGVAYTPSEDTYVNKGNPTAIYGSSVTIYAGDYWGNTSSTANGGMEIDIMETLGIWGRSETSHVLHWDGYDGGGSSVSNTGWGHPPVQDTSAFHTYGVYWEDGLIEFYIDGEKTAAFEDSRVASVGAYLLLSLQLGGWDGNTPTSAVDGTGLEVDWVRAWSGIKSTSPTASTVLNAHGDVVFGADASTYGGIENDGAKVTVTDAGDAFTVGRNGWVKFPVNYTVTANTMLEFTVDSSEAGEILGIGLDENNVYDDASRLFQLAGSQTWFGAWQDANNYPVESGALTYTINVGGYYVGAMSYLTISADNDIGDTNHARFWNIRIYEGSGGGGGTNSVGATNAGVASTDWRSGTGYIMYSAEDVYTRFNAFVNNADYLIAVYYSNGQWYADNNYGQVAFTPVPSDVLLASVTFGTSATVSSLEGQTGVEYGIEYGYASGNLVFTANQWNAGNDNNAGDFGVLGSSFTANGSLTSIGATNQGVAGTDWRSGSGYLMYSSENVSTRFNAFSGNADNVIAVYYSNGQWYADRNYGQVAFTPVASDVLLASIIFGTSATVSSLEGVNSIENGIIKGYSTGDLSYQANVWIGSGENPPGEFGVVGTGFTPW